MSKKRAGLEVSPIRLHSLEESGVKTPTAQLGAGTPQELLQGAQAQLRAQIFSGQQKELLQFPLWEFDLGR